MQPVCFELTMAPLDYDDAALLRAYAARYAEFWASWAQPARVITRIEPQQYAARQNALAAQLRPLADLRAQAPNRSAALWRWPWLEEERRYCMRSKQRKPPGRCGTTS